MNYFQTLGKIKFSFLDNYLRIIKFYAISYLFTQFFG